MEKHFRKYNSLDEFKAASPAEKPLVASMQDGGGKLVFFRSKEGRESYLTQGRANFRLGASPLGAKAVLK